MLLVLACLATRPARAADPISPNPTSMSFAAGGAIRMELNKGTMEVVGTSDDKITVSWRSSDRGDEPDVAVKLQRIGDKAATLTVDGPGNRMRYRIEVPRQSDVVIRMRAGQLDVRGVAGSLDAELMAGQMDLRVAEPKHYRNVSASLTAGEIDARPWNAETGGLWRSFKATGEGDYDLRARMLAGQLNIRPE
jgi:hypothetical protein